MTLENSMRYFVSRPFNCSVYRYIYEATYNNSSRHEWRTVNNDVYSPVRSFMYDPILIISEIINSYDT